MGAGARRPSSAFQVLARLLGCCHAALVQQAQEARGSPPRGGELPPGELLLLRWLLSELQADLRARLAVFFAAEGQGGRAGRTALLQNSQLWRTFSDSASRHSDSERRELVSQLMQLISAPAAEPGPHQPQQQQEAETAAFGADIVASLAAQLLGMLLELYSTAEDAGLFLRHGQSRATTSGGLANVRMVLEAAMVHGLVGSAQVLPALGQKRAFLAALHPRERLRLLTMVVSKGHARRSTDGANYPGLERLHFLFTNAGDVDACPAPQPVEALQYVLDDLPTGLSFNLLDRTADGLALLVSQLALAAAAQAAGGREVAEVLGKVVDAFTQQQAGCSQAKTLSPPALLSLRAAQHALTLAC